MAIKYLDEAGLQTFWTKIKKYTGDNFVSTGSTTITDNFALKTKDDRTVFGIKSSIVSGVERSSVLNLTGLPILSTDQIVASRFRLASEELALNTNFLMANGDTKTYSEVINKILKEQQIATQTWTTSEESYSVEGWINKIIQNTYNRDTINEKIDALSSKVTAVLTWKGTKDSLSEITSLTNVSKGDVWHNNADGKEYVATDAVGGTANPSVWEELGNTQDLSAYNEAIKNLEFGVDQKLAVLQWTNILGSAKKAQVPVASTAQTGVVRLYDIGSESDLNLSENAVVQLTANNAAYVSQKLTLKDSTAVNDKLPILISEGKVGAKYLPSQSDYFYYNPKSRTLFVETIKQTADVSETLPPNLGSVTVGGTKQIMYLKNGTLTAGEQLVAITTEFINSLV